VNIRPARVADVPGIHALIASHAERDKMILRPLDELYANLREFVVCEGPGGKVVGCAAVHIFWSDLAELKCLAVSDEFQRQGIGRRLCEALQTDLRRLGVSRVFTLTNSAPFFEKIGYQKVDKDALPRFIWGECVRCPSFPLCIEDALLLGLEKVSGIRNQESGKKTPDTAAPSR
jgi:amino-acid N-acetyltransferase